MSAVIRRLLAAAMLLIATCSLYAQNPMVLGEKFEIKADFIAKDSVLEVSYKNLLPFTQLVWTNDFSVAAIISPSDISGSFLASPITQEIYLVEKNLQLRKTSNSFFLRNDSSELDLYNYRILDPGGEMKVRLKVGNDSLYRLIVKKKIALKGIFSFVDFTNMELLASKNKENGKKSASLLAGYTQTKNPSNTPDPILLENIRWRFNRKANVMDVNGVHSGVAQEGRLSMEKLIHPGKGHNNKLIVFSCDELYRFSSKQVFDVEIAVKL